MITVREAANILGVGIYAVHGAIKRGRIKAKKFGVQYAVSENSVLEYLENRSPGPGRPGKDKEGDE